MSKRRALDVNIRKSETFAEFTFRQRDLWHGLITIADDQGRMPANPIFIKSQVWPYDDISVADVKSDLDTLETAGNIIRYKVDGRVYLQIINWWKYQTGEWFGISDYPAPPNWVDRARYHTKGNRIITLNWDTVGGYCKELPSTLPSTLPCRDVNDDVKDNDEGEVVASAAPAAAIPFIPQKQEQPKHYQESDVLKLVCAASGMVAIPPKEMQRIEQLYRLLESYGWDDTLSALKASYQKWTSTPRKNGTGNYSGINFAWVDWAQDFLAGNRPKEKSTSEMTDQEYIEWAKKQVEANA